MLDDLIKLADHLDMIGESEEASLIDEILPYLNKIASASKYNYMLQTQLSSISEKANTILSIVREGEPLEDWMETYVAQADLMIDNIFDKLTLGKYEGDSCECECEGSCGCAY